MVYSLKIMLKIKNKEMSNFPYTLSQSNPHSINKDYANWLSQMPWTFIATVRRHFPLSQFTCSIKSKQMLKRLPMLYSVFMVLEKDRGDDGMNHMHILLNTNGYPMSKADCSKGLGININAKAVNYFQKVESPECVGIYCSKHIGTKAIEYDYWERQMLSF